MMGLGNTGQSLKRRKNRAGSVAGTVVGLLVPLGTATQLVRARIPGARRMGGGAYDSRCEPPLAPPPPRRRLAAGMFAGGSGAETVSDENIKHRNVTHYSGWSNGLPPPPHPGVAEHLLVVGGRPRDRWRGCVVAEVSQPAVLPISQSASRPAALKRPDDPAPRGLGNPRYSRFGNLRYELAAARSPTTGRCTGVRWLHKSRLQTGARAPERAGE